MLQTAHLAQLDGASDRLIAAALLHDIGWPLGEEPHELAGAARVADWLGEDVAAPIRSHVAAKRWLVATEPHYAANLSAESSRTLVAQGGPMTSAECAAFSRTEGFADAIRLRRYDDAAKDPLAACPPLSAYTQLLHRIAEQHALQKGKLA
jgi:predicted HD phosphohydrolase